MKSLAIIGAGGHAKVVAEIGELNGWNDITLFDDKWPDLESVEHWEINGDFETFKNNAEKFDACFVAIGNNSTRKALSQLISKLNIAIINLVHPNSVISQYAKLGSGCVVMAGAVINPFSIIGDGAIINTGATIEHDCVLQNFTHISPGARLAGGVACAEGSWVGIGSSVLQSVKIGSFSVVGAGSVVLDNIANNVTVVGIPAKPINK